MEHFDFQGLRPDPSSDFVYAGDNGKLYQTTRGLEPLPTWVDKDGYTVARVGGRIQPVRRVVCRAWHGLPDPPYAVVVSKDGDRANTRPDNLRWSTPPRRGEQFLRAWRRRRTREG